MRPGRALELPRGGTASAKSHSQCRPLPTRRSPGRVSQSGEPRPPREEKESVVGKQEQTPNWFPCPSRRPEASLGGPGGWAQGEAALALGSCLHGAKRNLRLREVTGVGRDRALGTISQVFSLPHRPGWGGGHQALCPPAPTLPDARSMAESRCCLLSVQALYCVEHVEEPSPLHTCVCAHISKHVHNMHVPFHAPHTGPYVHTTHASMS